MDVKIKSDEGCFKYRVAGAVVVDGKILTVKIADNEFYCLPGGHIHLGESSLEAITREIGEEVGITCKSTKLVALIENFFEAKGKPMHEVCYTYIVEPNEHMETKDYNIIENDEGKMVPLEFKWVKLEELDTIDFRPNILVPKFKAKNFDFEYKISDERKKS